MERERSDREKERRDEKRVRTHLCVREREVCVAETGSAM